MTVTGSFLSKQILRTAMPIRPKPFIAMFIIPLFYT